jgi:hypothetical protein
MNGKNIIVILLKVCNILHQLNPFVSYGCVPLNRVTSSSSYNFVRVLPIFKLACCPCLLRYRIFKGNKVPLKYFLDSLNAKKNIHFVRQFFEWFS